MGCGVGSSCALEAMRFHCRVQYTRLGQVGGGDEK